MKTNPWIHAALAASLAAPSLARADQPRAPLVTPPAVAPVPARVAPEPAPAVALAPMAVPARVPVTTSTTPSVTTSTTTAEPSPASAHEYHRRSTSLFLTGAAGLGPSPGTSPTFTAGAVLGGTLRSVFAGLLVDPGLDVLFEPLQSSGSAAIFQLRPSLRIGYVGAVSERVALGVRGGYAPSLALAPRDPPGFIHQLDLDLHCTVVTRRGALIEPYLSGGILIADPVLPVVLLGVRIGAQL